MADRSEDRIDFDKLERELGAAVESDERYWRENDAKMRAVEQRVETYEQFRDMVAAAHIKPLDKEDKNGMLSGQGVSGRNQPWNPFSTKDKDGHQKAAQSKQDTKKDSPDLPSNSNDFTKQWRKLKENSHKYKFLLNIGGDKLVKIFHAEISFGLLGDILCVLNQGLNSSDIDAVVHILVCLSETNRFSLSLDFLSKSEKTQCSELVQKLETLCVESTGTEHNGKFFITEPTECNSDPNQSEDEHISSNSNSSNSKTNSKTISSNSKTGSQEEDEISSSKETHQTDPVTKVTVAQETVLRETLDRIKNIYKVLPVGR